MVANGTSLHSPRAERGGPIPDAHRSDAGLKYAAECLVIIANEIFWRLVPRKRLGDLPRQPFGRRMRRDGSVRGVGIFQLPKKRTSVSVTFTALENASSVSGRTQTAMV
jgi:hypothetical protein